MQQQELGAEAWSESRRYRVLAGVKRALFEPLLEDKEDGGAGKVADVGEDIPGRLGIAPAKT